MKRLGPVALVLGALAAGCMGGPPAPAPLNPVRFLVVGDVTGSDTLAGGAGGLARVATVRGRIANEGRVLLVAAGDILTNRAGGAPAGQVELLNAAKLDYATFGPGELALPYDTLASRVAASHFRWLSANCVALRGSEERAIPQVAAWDTVTVSKHKVGIFGLTDPGRYPAGSGSPAIRCADPDSAVRRTIDTLVARGAELIVGLTHQPLTADRELLLDESRLDLIVRGTRGTTSGDSVQDAIVGGRHVVTAAGTRTAQFVTLWGGKGQWRDAIGPVPIDTRIPPDTAVLRVAKQIPAAR